MRVLVLLLSLSLSAVYGEVTIRTVRSGGDYPATLAGLQSAVNYCLALNSNDPCVVEVVSNTAISGPLCALEVGPHTAGNKLLVVRTDRLSDLPSNQRAGGGDASKLALIDNNCSSAAGVLVIPPELTGVPGSPVPSRVLIQGLNLYYSGSGRNAVGALDVGVHNGATKATQYWQLPNRIWVDRSWMHGVDVATWVGGGTTNANQNGAVLNGRDITLTNSTLNNNNQDGVTYGQGESHGITIDNGMIFRAYNNEFDGSIGSLMGGTWNWIPGLLVFDTEWAQNFYTRNPWSWHWIEWDVTDTLDLAQPCVEHAFWQQLVAPFNRYVCSGGDWTPTVATRPNRGWTKNAWECKNCLYARARGNRIYQIPSTQDQSQVGYSHLLNNVDSQDFAFHARPEDVVVEFEYTDRIGQGPTVGWLPIPGMYKQTSKVRFRHILQTKLGGSLVSPTQGGIYTTGGGVQVQWSGLASNLEVSNITSLYDRTFGGAGLRGSDSAPQVADVLIRDNILGWGSLGQTPLDVTNESCASFLSVLNGAKYWDYFGLIDTNSRGDFAWSFVYDQPACPAHKSKAATAADVRFVAYNGGEGGDYRLCTAPGVPDPACAAASPWAAAGSFGRPLGADVAQVMYATNGVQNGNPDKNWRELRVRRADWQQVRYTAYAANGVCTGEIRDEATNTLADSWTDGGGLERDRSHTPAALASGAYYTRVTCSGRWADAAFRVY